MDLSNSDIETAISEAIAADTVTLPTLPDVALEVKRVAADPDSGMSDLLDVISTDASVSARMLKVANSPMMRRNDTEVTDLKVALTTMGMQYASNLAIGVAMAQMFQSQNDIVTSHLKDTWELSAEVASSCQRICQFVSGLEPSTAMLAGLVHKIGVLPVLSYAEEHPTLAADQDLLTQAINHLHPQFGAQILRNWDFSEALVKVCENYLCFGRDVPSADYADVVTVAVLERYVGSSHPLAEVELEAVTAYKRLNITPNSAFLGGGEEEIELSGTAADAAWAL